MKVLLILIVIAVAALCVLGWLLGHLRKSESAEKSNDPTVAREPQESALVDREVRSIAKRVEDAPGHKDVDFRLQGERGMGGPMYGDVMCADGVYLPHAWEMDFHVSFDGRWLRTGSYESETAYLIDRKSRRCWSLGAGQDGVLDGVNWRLPRWSGETINESGIADDGHVVFSDASFEAWLKQHIGVEARPLIAVRDIWVPEDFLPAHALAQPPVLPQPPEAGKPTEQPDLAAAPQLTLERHWPDSLRNLRYPLGPLNRPNWVLMLNGVAQPWVVDESHYLVWRDDAQAFALYAYPEGEDDYPSLQLAAWSAQSGWQNWDSLMPPDRKSWVVGLYFPETAQEGDDSAFPAMPVLAWEGHLLLQRVEVDTPSTERLHDGTSISCVMSTTDGCAGHAKDGQVQLAPIPRNSFVWLRDPAQATQWLARSESVQGQYLQWSLRKEAQDEQGETAAYSLQWGERHLPGVWALEHVVVQGRWAVLMPDDKAPVRGGSGALQIWDGERLHSVDLPWPVVRCLPVPSLNKVSKEGAARVGILALTACIADKDWNASTASWRWPLHSVSQSHLAREDWRPVYAMREIAPDATGRWRLLPSWREVHQIQHPCADGDYVWRDEARGDALWWWGGLNERISNYWSEDTPRFEGVTVTRSGMALCGTSPSACPHPAGEGWAVLEFVESSYSGAALWKLHWLNSVEKDLRTLELRARMPLLMGWDGQGLHWRESKPQEEDEGAAEDRVDTAPQIITPQMWRQAAVEPLRQGLKGLWLRKQDLRYAEVLQAQDDWPWQRLG